MTDQTRTAAIPAIVTRYVEAANRHDFDAVAACFAPEAVVVDEGRTYRGRGEIRAWKVRVTEKYQVTATLLEAEAQDAGLRIATRVEGRFPGSPAVLHYRIALEDGLIDRLEIGG